MRSKTATCSKRIFYDKNKTITRSYVRVRKSDLSKVLGTDKDDVNDGFASNCEGLAGFFCPRPGCYDNKYVAGAITGTKDAFKNNEITVISLPKIDECALKHLREEVYQYPSVMRYIPDRYYRKGPLKGQIIIDDVTFTASIFAKVEPAQYNKWIEKQKNLNSKRLEKEDNDYIEIEQEWWEKINVQAKTIHKKGKAGPMVFNHKRREELKRKRLHIEKLSTLNELKADKVWIPIDNDVMPENPPDNREFVLLRDYQEVKENNIKKEKEFHFISAEVRAQPYACIKGISDMNQRVYVYNNTKFVLENSWSKYNITIPTYDEAMAQWGYNGN